MALVQRRPKVNYKHNADRQQDKGRDDGSKQGQPVVTTSRGHSWELPLRLLIQRTIHKWRRLKVVAILWGNVR